MADSPRYLSLMLACYPDGTRHLIATADGTTDLEAVRELLCQLEKTPTGFPAGVEFDTRDCA